jgi:hypothetical protein
MSAIRFDAVADTVSRMGKAPSVLHVRRVPAYEVTFDALQVLVEEKLPAPDLAVLGLMDALGVATADDVRTYLGLGFEVSDALLQLLIKEGLIQQQGAASAEAAEDSLWTRVKALLGLASPPPPASRRPTQAQRVEPPDPTATGPNLELAEKGRDVLGAGLHPRVIERPCRMVIWADPPHVARAIPDGRQRFASDDKKPPLPPESVPEPLRRLDELFALPVNERKNALGLGEHLKGVEGRILGVVPNRQWEVRPAPWERVNLMVVAGFESSDLGGWVWRTFVGSDQRLELFSRLEPTVLGVNLEPALLQNQAAGLLNGKPGEPARGRGAFRLRCQGATLLELMGASDQPRDFWLPLGEADAKGWQSALLVRGLAASEQDAHLAMVELLSRHETSAQKDLRETARQVWTLLESYWEEPGALAPPPEQWLMEQLWQSPVMRKAVCAARLGDDLVKPYREARLPGAA